MTFVVAQAVLLAVLVAEALGVQVRVVVVLVGFSAVTVPLISVPRVIVTTESPLTVDITMVALK